MSNYSDSLDTVTTAALWMISGGLLYHLGPALLFLGVAALFVAGIGYAAGKSRTEVGHAAE